MSYSETYRNQALQLALPQKQLSGKIGWRSPSNIALVKYWGKRSPQLPMNPSISLTLKNAFTETSINYQFNPGRKDLELDYIFGGKQHDAFSNRVHKYLNDIKEYLPFINNLKLIISSSNSFPHSAGIASSASAFSTLALCLLDIELAITGNTLEQEDFHRKASFLARLGSGSASRSLFGGFVLWGNSTDIENSSDEIAIKISSGIHPVFMTFQDTILIIDDQEKNTSSSVGHELMMDNPYSSIRFESAKRNISKLYKVLTRGTVNDFINIVEYEALSLHAMMLTSYPGYFLMQPKTIEVIKRVRAYRNQTKVPVGFTLDAGPNVHLLYPEKHKKEINSFIHKELSQFCMHHYFISDCIGEGPVRI